MKLSMAAVASAFLLLSCTTFHGSEPKTHPETTAETKSAAKSNVKVALRKVKIDKDLTIAVPTDMKETPVQGIDSLVKVYENSESSLSFDYGAYAGDLVFFQNVDRFSMRQTTVGGRNAKIAHFYSPAETTLPYYSEVSVRHIRKGEVQNGLYNNGSEKNLLLTIRCRTKECQNRSEGIFRAIEIAPE